MLTAFHRLLGDMPPSAHLIDRLLLLVARSLQKEFIYWVDGGSGIGYTSSTYAQILEAEIGDPAARVYCYDPLPENFREMSRRLQGTQYVLRDVALSDVCGEAKFVVPIRSASAGAWPEGTSWGGSLKYPTEGKESVTVRSVRLADEEIPRFDYVKLDLQGGELDALKGMGDRLGEAKLLYIETQLLTSWQNSMDLVMARGFVPFYDRLQLGFKEGLKFVPFELLKDLGVSVDRLTLPLAPNEPLTAWGHFTRDRGVIDASTMVLTPESSEALRAAGVTYVQTDAICINGACLRQIAPLITL